MLAIAGLVIIPAIFISRDYTAALEPMISIGTSPEATESLLPGTEISTDTQEQIFTFINTPDLPVLDDWATIFPNIGIGPGIVDDVIDEPDVDTDIPDNVTPDQPQEITIASLWNTWQEIKNQPIGVDIDTEQQQQTYDARKQIFDIWFEADWQNRNSNLPNWIKTVAYNMWEFDFSQDWAWNQFLQDHPEIPSGNTLGLSQN